MPRDQMKQFGVSVMEMTVPNIEPEQVQRIMSAALETLKEAA